MGAWLLWPGSHGELESAAFEDRDSAASRPIGFAFPSWENRLTQEIRGEHDDHLAR